VLDNHDGGHRQNRQAKKDAIKEDLRLHARRHGAGNHEAHPAAQPINMIGQFADDLAYTEHGDGKVDAAQSQDGVGQDERDEGGYQAAHQDRDRQAHISDGLRKQMNGKKRSAERTDAFYTGG
jgi:hypothetical protein